MNVVQPGGWSVRAALLALLAAAAVFGWTLRRALRIEPVAAPPVAAPQPASAIVRRPGTSEEALVAAVEAGPFHPERRRPTVAFRLPGEVAPGDSAGPGGLREGEVRLLGTAVLPGGKAFAMLEWPGQPPKVIHPGETVGGLTLKTVERGRAVFVSAAGATVVLQVQTAGT